MTTPDQVSTFLSNRTSGPDIFNFAVVLPGTSNDDSNNNNNNRRDKIIGILGSHNFPKIGYIFHPGYSKRGYATEALSAFLPRFFSLLPSASSATEMPNQEDSPVSQGYDLVIAHVDLENEPSSKLLERVGFERGEVTRGAYMNPNLGGARDDVTFRLARPGLRLEDVLRGIRDTEEGDPPVPDLM